MNKLEKLTLRQKELNSRLEAILEVAKNENRADLNESEIREWDRLKPELDEVTAEIDRLRDIRDFTHDRGSSELDPNRRYVPGGPDGNFGISNSDLSGYSLLRAIRNLANNKPLDGLEGEMSAEMARRSGRPGDGQEANSFSVPLQVLVSAERRDLTVGTPTAGGNTVFDQPGSFIEILRKRLVLAQLGAEIMGGLRGDVPFPRQTAKAVASWKGEVSALDETNPAIGQVNLTPNRVGGYTEVS